jgi:hypothetical protein
MEYILVSLLSLSIGYFISVLGHKKLWAKYTDAKIKLHNLRHRMVAVKREFPRADYMETNPCNGPNCDLMWDIEL